MMDYRLRIRQSILGVTLVLAVFEAWQGEIDRQEPGLVILREPLEKVFVQDAIAGAEWNSSEKTKKHRSKKLKIGLPENMLSQADSSSMSNPLQEEKPNFLERLYLARPYATDSDQSSNAGTRFDNGSLTSPFYRENPLNAERDRNVRREQFGNLRQSMLRGQAQEIVRNADQDSGMIRVLKSLRGLFGFNDLFGHEEVGKKPTRRANPNDVGIKRSEYKINSAADEQEVARIYLKDPNNQEAIKEPKPRFRTNLNVIRQAGNIDFENPILTPGARVDMRDADRFQLKAKREIKAISLKTTFSYGPTKKSMMMDLDKKITDQLSCEVRSTKSERKDVISEDSLRFNFNVLF